MAKTLNQLINEATQISRQLTSGDIPIVCRGCQDIELELKQHDVALWVELKLKRRVISPEDFKSIIANQKPQSPTSQAAMPECMFLKNSKKVSNGNETDYQKVQ